MTRDSLMPLPVEDLLISVYCLVDGLLPRVLQGKKLRTRGPKPLLDDSEVLTMEIVGALLKKDAENGLWAYFDAHWRSHFPRLGDRTTFTRQAANLWKVKRLLQRAIAAELGAFDSPRHIIDGVPMRVCRWGRAARCRLFPLLAHSGYCASQKEYFYGFKGHLVITDIGVITAFQVTAANIDEREAAWEVLTDIQGELLGDKGYLSKEFQDELSQVFIELKTPLRKNMTGAKEANAAFPGDARRLIETVIGQLTERFRLGCVRARDQWHLNSRIARSLLSHTVAVFFCQKLGLGPLKFSALVAA